MLIPTRADLDEVIGHLDSLGAAHSPVITATLGWLLSAPDPDGILLSFYTAEQHPAQSVLSPGQGTVLNPSP